VVLYEKLTTDRIHQVLEVAAPRFTFKARIRNAAHQALATLCHEEED
jgi:hypothetical protein